MAEFSEVMKQLARMANACNGECDKCPLDDSVLCTGPWCFGNTESIAEAERIVMQWAAERPEPVYPTWYEWLANMSVVPIELPLDQAIFVTDIGLLKKIPADIAEKLGIKPKEG